MDHDHCSSCFLTGCKVVAEDGCRVEECPNVCGTALHACKIESHVRDICPEAVVPCINAQYGCKETIRRLHLGAHLEHCPASVLMCKFPHRGSPGDPIDSLPFDPYCNEVVVRRDEYAAHWKTLHHDIYTHFYELFERCPLRDSGCSYRQQHFLPSPRGSTLQYDKDNSMFLIKLPEIIDTSSEAQMSGHYAAEIQKKQQLALYGYSDEEDESYDVLGQLPPEVLDKICNHLDSLGLWCLSQVNHYLRSVCQHVAKRKGIVYQLWRFDETCQGWVLGPKVIIPYRAIHDTQSFSGLCSDHM